MLTMDYKNTFSFWSPLEVRPDKYAEAALKLAKSCVRSDGVDGGEVSWKGIGWKIKISLAHSTMPYVGTGPGKASYTDLTRNGNGNAASVAEQTR